MSAPNYRLIKGPVRAFKKLADIEQPQSPSSHSGLSEDFVLRGSAVRINEVTGFRGYSKNDLSGSKSHISLSRDKKSKSVSDEGKLHIRIPERNSHDFTGPKDLTEYMNMVHLAPTPLEAMDLHDSMLSGEIYDPNYDPRSPALNDVISPKSAKQLKSPPPPPKPLKPDELVQVLVDEENPYPSIIEYHASGFQADLYNQIHPHADDLKYHSHGPVCQYFIHAFTYSGGKLNRELFDLAFKKTRKAFPELKTFFHRNDLIVDADVKAFLPGSALPQYKVWSTFDKKWIEYIEKNERDSKFITKYVQQFIKTHQKVEQLFKLFIFDALSDKPIIVQVISNLIADEVSSYTIVNELIRNYKAVSAEGPNNKMFKRTVARDYIFAQQCEYMHQNVSPATWANAVNVIRDQVTEFAQVDATLDDKDKVKVQLIEAKKKKEHLQQQVNLCLQRCEELYKEIEDVSAQRRAFDQPMAGQGVLWSYIDSVSREVVQIQHHTKDILVKAVLGDDAPGDTIDFFLKKHEVTIDTLERLEADKMSVEKFMQLDSNDFETMKIAQAERRKISALVDYVRSTVKESVEEQGKAKFALERRIQRARRDLDAAESKLEVMRREYDRSEEEVIRCEIALNPNIVKKPIPLLRIPYGKSSDTVAEEQISRGVPASFKDYSTAYCFFPISFPTRQDIEKHMDDYSEKGPRTIHILTLSALSIIMRHVCGKTKFVFGHAVQNRIDPLHFTDHMIYNTPIGAWTRVVPFQVDLRDLQVTLQDFMKETSTKYAKVAPMVDFICPSLMSKVMEGCMYEENSSYVDAGMYGFPVQFQYVGPYHPLNKDVAESELQDEWFVNENDLSDLKLYVREFEDGHVEGGFWYRPDLMDKDKIKKWAERLQAVMASVANNQAGKLSIANLIGRFYQKLWTDTNTSMVGLGSTTLFSSRNAIDGSLMTLEKTKSMHIMGSSYRLGSMSELK